MEGFHITAFNIVHWHMLSLMYDAVNDKGLNLNLNDSFCMDVDTNTTQALRSSITILHHYMINRHNFKICESFRYMMTSKEFNYYQKEKSAYLGGSNAQRSVFPITYILATVWQVKIYKKDPRSLGGNDYMRYSSIKHTLQILNELILQKPESVFLKALKLNFS
jgi:hypothetical protein